MKLLMKLSFLIFLCFFSSKNYCQGEVNTVQPSIMVIPFVKEGQDIRTILDNDFNKRIAITKTKEGFDQRGFTTVDFKGKLMAALKTEAMESENKSSLKQRIIEQSGAEIYVEVDINVSKGNSGNSVSLILTAFDAFSGQSLSNKVGESGRYYTDNIEKLVVKSVENCIDPFLNTMNEKFGDIVKNGRTVIVNIGFDPDSDYTMDSEVGEDELPLSDALEIWFEENSYKNYYNIQGVTSTKMTLDDVRIPLKDSNGNNFKTSKFALKIYLFIKKNLGLSCKKDVNGTTIYISIL